MKFLRKIYDERDESLNNVPSKSYNRYDDRYYARDDQYRDPGYAVDNRYITNNNYNSGYRGNGKSLRAFFA